MKKEADFLLSLLVIAATSYLEIYTLGLLSNLLTPAKFIWAEFGITLTTNILQDSILGVNPFSQTNLLINVGIPYVRSLRSLNMIRGLNKSTLRSSKFNLIKNDDFIKNSKLIDKLHDDLHEMQIQTLKLGVDDIEYNPKFKMFEEKYENVLDKFAFNDPFFYEKEKQRIRIYKKQISNFHKSMYKSWNPRIITPSYHVEKFVEKLTAPLKNKIKSVVGKFWKKINKKLSKAEKILYKSLIPLHHTQAEWIKGIRIQRVGQKGLLYFAVQVVFDKQLTNGKKSVMLFAQRPRDIQKFIEAPSAGRFYLNNYAYGWKIGKLIRKSGAYESGAIAISYISQWTPHLSFWINNAIRLSKWEQTINNFDSLLKWTNIKNAAIQGAIKGIPGMNFLKNAFTSSTNMQQVMRNEFKRRYRKKIRQKQIKKMGWQNGFYKFYDI